jgi:hypothetical protein
VWPAVLPDEPASLFALGRVGDWTAEILKPSSVPPDRIG